MTEEGLKQRIEKMRGPCLYWKPKQGGARMKKRVLTELSKTIAEIKEKMEKMMDIGNGCSDKETKIYILGRCYQASKNLKALDSEEGKT